MFFCRTRLEKQPICSKLEMTHFVDDRIHIMHILKNTVKHLYLFGDKTRHKAAHKWTTLVENWEEVHTAIIRDFTARFP